MRGRKRVLTEILQLLTNRGLEETLWEQEREMILKISHEVQHHRIVDVVGQKSSRISCFMCLSLILKCHDCVIEILAPNEPERILTRALSVAGSPGCSPVKHRALPAI